MTLDLHPSAAKRFDELAMELCVQVTPPRRESTPAEGFPIDPYVAGTITQADVIEFGHWGRRDRAGEEIARYTEVNGKTIGVEGNTYIALQRLAERMQATSAFRDRVAVSVVFDLLFEWVCTTAATNSQQSSASEYLTERASALVDQHTIIIPLFDIFLENPVCISDIELRAITREEIDEWEEEWRKEYPGSDSEVEASALEWRRELQGKAAAVYTVNAEQERAYEITRAKAEDAVAMLRNFSLGIIDPRVQSFCTLKGSERTQYSIHAHLRDGRMRGMNSYLNAPLGTFWRIGSDHLEWMQENGLAEMSELLKEEARNEFQTKLLESLLMYSRAALESGLAEKLLYVIVALETILLRNDTEPIQASISERFAFAIGENSADRKQISRTVKDAYGLRSKFVHHGNKVADVSTMQDFLVLAFLFFTRTVLRHRQFSSKDQFIESLEERKWA